MNEALGYEYRQYLVDDPNKLPKTRHNIIVEFITVEESDGYEGTSSKKCARIYAFTDDVEWERAVEKLALTEGKSYEKPKFLAYKGVSPANVSVKAHITIA